MVNFHTSSCIDQSRDGDSKGFARTWLLPFSFIRRGKVIFCTRELRCLLAWGKPVCLVYLVCFVCLVDLVHLVSFVQPKKPDKPDRPNEQGRLANFFSLLLFRHEDQHPGRAFFDHVSKPSSGTTGGDSWKDGSSANLNGAETIGGGWRREQGGDSWNFPA
jgi:hypothetical protein